MLQRLMHTSLETSIDIYSITLFRNDYKHAKLSSDSSTTLAEGDDENKSFVNRTQITTITLVKLLVFGFLSM